MSHDPIQSAIQQLRNSVLATLHILIKKINDCYVPLVDQQILEFVSTVCDDFLKVWMSPARSSINSENLVVWFAFEKDLRKVSVSISDNAIFDRCEHLINDMLSDMFKYLTSFQNGLQNIETIENDRIRLMFIGELFSVALREIHGRAYYDNLMCGSKVSDKLTVDAVNEMHEIAPLSTSQLDDFRSANCFRDDSVRTIAYSWGIFRTLTPKYSDMAKYQKKDFLENMRQVLHDLLRIYQAVTKKYRLGLKQFTDYLLEKQKRNEIVHYAESIRKYAQNRSLSGCSLEDFIKTPENKHIGNAIDQEKHHLNTIFEYACRFQLQSSHKQ